MTSLSYINSLIVIFCLTSLLASCGQFKSKKTAQTIESINENTIRFDTSNTSIIPFNQKDKYPFNNSYQQAICTQEDIGTIDSLLIACVNDYNHSLSKDQKVWSIDLKKNNYKKQLIVATNKKGEKEVWVNCFCNWGKKNWKKEILHVNDGGNCYFNLKLNLTTKQFYHMMVNGDA